MLKLRDASKKCGVLFLVFFVLAVMEVPLTGSGFQSDGEGDEYFKNWVEQDVIYIISEEEEQVFQRLTTAEEREFFIEQFWLRRDTDPRTATNDFKEEHYRRIAYANENFSSGIPGWQTDRGRIYIIHGPPRAIESHPSGGSYRRHSQEGGGGTSTYPFEVWRYGHLEGLGTHIAVEFVDPTMSGEYRMAMTPEEKDALLLVPGAGLTAAESIGLTAKVDRPFFLPGNTNSPFRANLLRDNPFERYELYTKIQRPATLGYKDLKNEIGVGVTYDDLPFTYRIDYFKLNDSTTIIPVTIEVANRYLDFNVNTAARSARLVLYGRITSLGNRIVEEFDTDLVLSYSGQERRSTFQQVLVLERRGRYKLDLVLKDTTSGKIGVRRAVVVPENIIEGLSVSSLFLSDTVTQLVEVPDNNTMFVLGDLLIRPSLRKVFLVGVPMQIYFQAYGVKFDQSTASPSLHVLYRVSKEGQIVDEYVDELGTSIQFFSDQRVVLLHPIATSNLSPGRYQIAIVLRDKVSNKKISIFDQFDIRVATDRLQ